MSSNQANLKSNLTDLTAETSRTVAKRGRSSAQAARLVARTVSVITNKEGSEPTLSRVQKETGCAYATVRKYWPGAGKPTGRGRKPRLVTEAAENRAPAVPPLSRELVQMVSELVHGTALVAGTYTTDDGVACCDSVENHNEKLTPLIHAWRRHEDEVAQILATARDLSSSCLSNAAVASV